MRLSAKLLKRATEITKEALERSMNENYAPFLPPIKLVGFKKIVGSERSDEQDSVDYAIIVKAKIDAEMWGEAAAEEDAEHTYWVCSITVYNGNYQEGVHEWDGPYTLGMAKHKMVDFYLTPDDDEGFIDVMEDTK
jgi:hypothetical protein